MVRRRTPLRVLGGPHDDFWEFCGRSELRLQRCARCQRYAWPPALVCSCGHSDLSWEKLSGLGRVVSHCTFRRQYYEECPPPWQVVLVELDEGAWFVSNPLGDRSEEIASGSRVKVAFIPAEDEAGEYQLPVFSLAAD